jgi:hypothetical protein
LAATQAGYRAGLLGSIAASCTASATVTLNAPGGGTMTSTEPLPVAEAADAAALYDALTVEHATIYGYGIVSAHPPRMTTTWWPRR